MTPEDRALIQRVGNVIQTNLAPTIALAVFYGPCVWLFVLCMLRLLRRDMKSKASRTTLALVIASFVIITLYLISYITLCAIQIKGAFVDSGGRVNRAALNGVNQRVFPVLILQSWTGKLVYVISDGIVVWRTWVLYTDKLWVMLSPCFLLFATAGLTLTSCVLGSTLPIVGADPTLRSITSKLYTTTLSISLATNAIATLLILLKFRAHFRLVGRRSPKSTSPLRNIMLVLVESGFAFCGFQLINLVLDLVRLSSSTLQIIAKTAINIFTITAAMYPSIVVVLVSKQRSMIETFIFNTEIGNLEGDCELPSPPSGKPARPVLALEPIQFAAASEGSTPTRVGAASVTADRMVEKRFGVGTSGLGGNGTRSSPTVNVRSRNPGL